MLRLWWGVNPVGMCQRTCLITTDAACCVSTIGIMTKTIFGLLLVLFCTTTLGYAAQPGQENSANASQNEARGDRTSAGQTDLRTDLDKMNTLLGQMQKNAAFVSAGDTPLKHQFELEIEMWQLLLRDMEKKVDEQKLR
jgi:hypothetical protein